MGGALSAGVGVGSSGASRQSGTPCACQSPVAPHALPNLRVFQGARSIATALTQACANYETSQTVAATTKTARFRIV